MRVCCESVGALLFVSLVVFACAADAPLRSDGENESFLASGAADSWGVSDGSPEAQGVLRVANELDKAELSTVVGPVASTTIVGYRAGADELVGTADDRTIGTLEELDDIRFVGPNTFGNLLQEAARRGWIGESNGEVVDPDGNVGTGTIVVNFPDQPFVNAPKLTVNNRIRQGFVSTNANSTSAPQEATVQAGTYCISMTVHEFGTTQLCNIAVRVGEITIVEASSTWVGDMDIMTSNFGPSIERFSATFECADCDGNLTLEQRRRNAWSYQHVPVFAGNYVIEYRGIELPAVTRTIEAGRAYDESFLPEEDYRSFLYVSADSVQFPTAPTCARAPVLTGAGHSLEIVFEPDNGKRVAQPVYYFPQAVGDLLFSLPKKFGPMTRTIEATRGEATFIHLRRLDVDDIEVNTSGSGGDRVETVSGTYDVRYGADFESRVGRVVCGSLPTRTGIDLLPGRYTVQTHYSASSGSGSGEYEVDLR